jgi:hypothetical protein
MRCVVIVSRFSIGDDKWMVKCAISRNSDKAEREMTEQTEITKQTKAELHSV